MRPGASDEVMSTAFVWDATIQAWSPDGELLAEDVPINAGSISWNVADRKVPEQVDLVVPRYSVVDGRRFDWLPQEDVTHPLANFGQTLSISVTVRSIVSRTEWVTDLARVRIQNWEEDEDGAVKVAASGLLQAAADDKMTVPQSPDEAATLVSEFARLLPGTLSVWADLVTDRAALPGTQWAGAKIDALYDIADALPARLRSDEDGTVLLLPPLDEMPIPTAAYRDGEVKDGYGMATLVSAPRSDTRDGVINSVTVLSNYEGEGGQKASVTVEQTTGPFAVDTYGRVNETWSSEQIETEEQARAAGRERLIAGLRPARTLTVQAVPDPRVEPDDPIRVLREDVERTGYVLGVTLDLLGEDPMEIVMSIASETKIVPQPGGGLGRPYGEGEYGSGLYGF